MRTSPTTPSLARRRRGGFTLIEIMVVVAILGLLVMIVGPQVLGSKAEADKKAAIADVARIYDAVQQFMLRNNNRIPTMEELITPDDTGYAYLPNQEEPPVDPWGNEYEIRTDPNFSHIPIVVCWGPDGQQDTEDDITSKNMRRRKRSDR